MGKLFYRKPIAILMVAGLMVLVFLLCMLLVTLTQLSSLRQTAEDINALLEKAATDEQARQELINYKGSDKYVIDWAVSKGMIPNDVYNYIPKK